jgi:predicted transposase/invertase (TIGR01784 family)
LSTITKADQPMGIEQAIQEELKRQAREEGLALGIERGIEQGVEQGIEQGIELGEAKRDEELLKNAVPELFQMGLDAQRISNILNLSLEDIQDVIDRL